MAKRIAIQRFRGIDRRRDRALSDPETFWELDNLDITTGGTLRTRPGTTKIAQLPAESVGLFAANGSLQTVAPAGHLDLYRRIPYVITNFIGDGTIYERDALQSLDGVEVYGASAIEANPYLAVRVTRGGATAVEHHYITVRPDTGSEAIDTRVTLPFIPTGGLQKLSEKLWTPDQATGVIRFSSSLRGPSNWEEPEDAGFIPVLNNLGGSRTIVGLAIYQNRLAVFFEDAVQIWTATPNPDNITLIETLEGPGTLSEKALINVRGDLYYLSRGGIASLGVATVTATSNEVNIGAPVADLTTAETAEAVAVWSQRTNQALFAFGSTVYAFTASPFEEVRGWSRWTLPFEVTAWAQNDGTLYARGADHGVYQFDPGLATDSGVPIGWGWQTQFLHAGDPFRRKQFRSLHLIQDGTVSVSTADDIRQPSTFATVGVQSGDTSPWGRIPLFSTTDSVSLKGVGSGSYELTGVVLEAEML